MTLRTVMDRGMTVGAVTISVVLISDWTLTAA